MQIQVNSDNHIKMDAALSGLIEKDMQRILARFADHITRVEIHLSDVNASKAGPEDKRCRMEARPAGHQPVSVSADAATVEQAAKSAAEKMKSALDTIFGRASQVR
jgi:hypothetical protein